MNKNFILEDKYYPIADTQLKSFEPTEKDYEKLGSVEYTNELDNSKDLVPNEDFVSNDSRFTISLVSLGSFAEPSAGNIPMKCRPAKNARKKNELN